MGMNTGAAGGLGGAASEGLGFPIFPWFFFFFIFIFAFAFIGFI